MKHREIMECVLLLIVIGLFIILADDTCSSSVDDVKKCSSNAQSTQQNTEFNSENNIYLQSPENKDYEINDNIQRTETDHLYKADDNKEDADVNKEEVADVIKEEVTEETEIEEFPPLIRIEPGTVGDVVFVELEDGKTYKRITRAVNPPVFEIPHYLSEIECDLIIKLAQYNSLEQSEVLGADIKDEYKTENIDISRITRVSEQTWLTEEEMPSKLWQNLTNRLSRLIQLPTEVIQLSEAVQVVSYSVGGHYHAHLDTSKTSEYGHLPCCFQAPHCYGIHLQSDEFEECCRICRYITVLYYLNDVEAGGETAFPLADTPDSFVAEKLTHMERQSWFDLTNFCHNASLVVKPKRGTAIMWYNHLLDLNTSYLGDTDLRSYHGGCDIIKGNKWIANNWITATTFKDRQKSWFE